MERLLVGSTPWWRRIVRFGSLPDETLRSARSTGRLWLERAEPLLVPPVRPHQLRPRLSVLERQLQYQVGADRAMAAALAYDLGKERQRRRGVGGAPVLGAAGNASSRHLAHPDFHLPSSFSNTRRAGGRTNERGTGVLPMCEAIFCLAVPLSWNFRSL